tara:strand:- start:208 stop:711 length:504 start_codon:yes stop_codon:yes gene_type:complete
MKYKPFKMKGHELPGPNQRNSPAKHSSNRGGAGETHNDTYGEGHDNSAHPEYWKIKKQTVPVKTGEGRLESPTEIVDIYLSDKEKEIVGEGELGSTTGSMWEKSKSTGRTEADVGKTAYVKGPKKNKKSTKKNKKSNKVKWGKGERDWLGRKKDKSKRNKKTLNPWD